MHEHMIENCLTLSDEGHMFLRHLLLFRKELFDHFMLIIRLCHVYVMCQINGFTWVASRTFTGSTSNLITVFRCRIHSTGWSTWCLSTEGATLYNLLIQWLLVSCISFGIKGSYRGKVSQEISSLECLQIICIRHWLVNSSPCYWIKALIHRSTSLLRACN